jgi:hypothetical protein
MKSPGNFPAHRIVSIAGAAAVLALASFPAAAADHSRSVRPVHPAALLMVHTAAAARIPISAWPPVSAQTRPWAWWWWHGSAVDETNLAHELQRFHEAGLGGVQITSIYGTKGAEARDIPYLSPRWLTVMGYTVDEARRLGMGVDMSLGSGWCFGGPTVSDRDANASVVVKTYQVPPGSKLDAKFDHAALQALVAYSADGAHKMDLADTLSAAGEADWVAPAISTNPWTVYAISQKPSGQKVKRPGPGGEGWMLNPAFAQAVRDWLPWFDHALTNYSGSKPEAVFQDSYEYRTDWAPDFFDQFEQLRGYQLQNELPALFGEAQDDHAGRVKYDYRLTLSDIMARQSEPAWIDWAHQHGFGAIYQAHGTPANWLDLYGDADMPETEMFHNDRNILISKFASSAAHTQGHPLTGAETGTWLKEHFTETLADLKYLADDMFLAGINHIYYHGACYSPDDAAWPGWLFYASTEMNPRNSIWHDVGALNEYITRCQSVLQAGRPDNDVLLYWPVADFWSDPAGRVQPMAVGKTEWFEGQAIGKTAHELWDQGCAFDYVSDAQLLQAGVRDGKITMPGADYQVVVVPECRYIPAETLKQLLVLAQKGAKVIFENHLPPDVPGWSNLEQQRAALKQLEASIPFPAPGSDGLTGAAVMGQGQVFELPLKAGLEHAGVSREPMADAQLAFVRRSLKDGYYCFIANRGGQAFDGWVTLDRFSRSVVVLDPMTGRTGVAAIRQNGAYPTQVHLALPAGGSIIVKAFGKFDDKEVHGPAWTDWRTNGQPAAITGQWNVKFTSGGPSLPAEFQTAKLASWTTFPDTNAQTFAGTAKYEITFDAPPSGKESYELNLGEVRQSARVRLNGQDCGTLIAPPFSVVVDHLKRTGNVLEVEVTSVAANRIRDLDRRGVNWKIFKDINIVDINYHPFNAADWPLTDCGLLGPVTLTPLAVE